MNQAQIMAQMRKMQQDAARMQEELSKTVVEGAAGGGAVTVAVNGDLKVTKVSLKPEAVDPDDIETLEDLVVVALNDALTKIETVRSTKMAALTGGMRIPGLM
jgi:DNA-binding YbaB/EbfC family protein